MRITTEQQAILDDLICERLRDNPDSEKLMMSFQNEKGSLIVDYLKQRALDEDLEGSTAFYIVRTKENDVLMFFSLKCGEVFDPLSDEDEISEGFEEYLITLQALKNAEADPEAQKRAVSKLKELSSKKGLPLHIVLNDILRKAEYKRQSLCKESTTFISSGSNCEGLFSLLMLKCVGSIIKENDSYSVTPRIFHMKLLVRLFNI